ncbi:MAG: Crp/Fnr family transcriptional regulator [Bacteroidota bacterium]
MSEAPRKSPREFLELQDRQSGIEHPDHRAWRGTEIKVPKGTILQQNGETASKVYYVKKGLLRSYLIDRKGKEHIFMFASEGWTIADSSPPDAPAEMFIDAVEPSLVEVSDKLFQLEADLPEELRKLRLTKLLNRIYVLQKRVIMLMSAPAIERYEHFLETYPEIVPRVPQRMIASYLGITPEALSKVKGEYARRR